MNPKRCTQNNMLQNMAFTLRFLQGKCKTYEEVFQGFQKLLDDQILFMLDDVMVFLGRALLRRGKIIPDYSVVYKDNKGKTVDIQKILLS